MTKPGTGGGELLIDLDLAGLAALMKAIEAAMAGGRGQLDLGSDGGIKVRSGPSEPYSKLIVTFARPADPPDENWRSRRPEPEPEPRLPILVLQD